jgi:hypothetical protein
MKRCSSWGVCWAILALGCSLNVMARDDMKSLSVAWLSSDWQQISSDWQVFIENNTLDAIDQGVAVRYEHPLAKDQGIALDFVQRVGHTSFLSPGWGNAYDLDSRSTEVSLGYRFRQSIYERRNSSADIIAGVGLGYWLTYVGGGEHNTSMGRPLFDRKQHIFYLPVSIKLQQQSGAWRFYDEAVYRHWLRGYNDMADNGMAMGRLHLTQPNGYGWANSIGVDYRWRGHWLGVAVNYSFWLMDFSDVAQMHNMIDDERVLYRMGKKSYEEIGVALKYTLDV